MTSLKVVLVVDQYLVFQRQLRVFIVTYCTIISHSGCGPAQVTRKGPFDYNVLSAYVM